MLPHFLFYGASINCRKYKRAYKTFARRRKIEFVDVFYRQEHGEMVLRIFLDSRGDILNIIYNEGKVFKRQDKDGYVFLEAEVPVRLKENDLLKNFFA